MSQQRRGGPDGGTSLPISVMVLDDNPQVVAGLERWFARSDDFQWVRGLFRVEGIDEALILHAPRVVLMDWDMPGVDTAALLARLTNAFPAMIFAVLSAHVRPEYVHAALRAGARGYLGKSLSMPELAASVRRLAGGQGVLSPDAEQALEEREEDNV